MKSKLHLVSHFKKEQKKTYMYVPLLCLTVITFTLAILAVSDLEWEDKITIRKGLQLFVYGLAFFTCLYQSLTHILVRTHFGHTLMKHHRLTVADMYDISNKGVSAVQAVFCCATGVTVCSYSCTRNMLTTSHYISEGYAWFGAAYFFYDIWSMYRVHGAKIVHHQSIGSTVNNGDAPSKRLAGGTFIAYLREEAVMVGHHLFIGAFGFLVITYLRGGLGDCFFGFVYLMEISTPFVSLRGILSKVGLKSSRLYVINGLVMLVTFFVCRVAMFPYVIYLYGNSVGLDYVSAINSLPRGCKISILILLLPQIYWFMLMIRGASQVLMFGSGQSRQQQQQQQRLLQQSTNMTTITTNTSRQRKARYL